MLTVISARNPKYTNAEGTGIDLFVTFKEIQGELPFHAMPSDPHTHGVELYNNAKAGMYGVVAPYVPPPTGKNPAPTNQQPTSIGTVKI